MKTPLLSFGLLCLSLATQAQTITYANFSALPNRTITCNVAVTSSFNTSLATTTGTGVTWNASGLQANGSVPNLNIGYHPVSSSPTGSLYPNADYTRVDPAYASMMGYEYYQFNADSMVFVGNYSSSGQHEIYQNGDKYLVFPFAYGQTVTDNYEKTNYSNATTVSSYQTGTRTLNYNGYGTLILPQATFNNVALISSSRTNSLGSTSYDSWWYDINSGMLLMLFRNNSGSTTVIYFNGTTVTAITQAQSEELPVRLLNNGNGLAEIKSLGETEYKLQTMDVAGHVLMNSVLAPGASYTLPDSYTEGIYLVRLEAKGVSRMLRVIK